jgi:Ca2+-binding RTX toxin-like protein
MNRFHTVNADHLPDHLSLRLGSDRESEGLALGSFADVPPVSLLQTTAAGSSITGTAGNDSLSGTKGNDTLDGGAGADTLAGGKGGDLYIVDNQGDVINEQSKGGTDVVQASLSWTLGSNLEKLVLTGHGNFDGTGNTLDNKLTGNDGDNLLNGSTGKDTLAGGLGDDTYIVDDLGDVVNDYAGEGTDTVKSSVNWTLGMATENLTLKGDLNLWGAGNSADNKLHGNAGANQLMGYDGDDVLDGMEGADTLIGGLGNDIYVVDNAKDVITELANQGTDLVRAYVNWTLSDNFENMVLEDSASISGTGNDSNNGITGNSGENLIAGNAGDDTISGQKGNDTLLGGDGNDFLDGGEGVDSMAGGAGNDVYILDKRQDLIEEGENQGTDEVQTTFNYTLHDNFENLTLLGTDNLTGTGNELINYIRGNSGDNLLTGSGTGDTLDGGLGADTMTGGTVYVVDNPGDVILDDSLDAFDAIKSSIDWTLATDFENLILIGEDNINATGNELANYIVGNQGDNIITGINSISPKGLHDTLSGGDGNDIFQFNSSDIYYIYLLRWDNFINGGAGEDTLSLVGSNTYLNTPSLETNTLQSIEKIDLTGTGNNSLRLYDINFSESNFINSANASSLGWTNGTYSFQSYEKRMQLIVDGNAGDAVYGLSHSKLMGTVIRGGNTYSVYNSTQTDDQYIVDTDITTDYVPKQPNTPANASGSATGDDEPAHSFDHTALLHHWMGISTPDAHGDWLL